MAGGIGPQLPPEVAAMLGIPVNQQHSDEDPDSDVEIIGPAMPPPGALSAKPQASGADTDRSTSKGEEEESEDDDLVGPSAALAGYSKEQALRQTIDMLEARTRKDPGDSDSGEANDSKEKREEWMLVPPSAESSKAVKGSRGGGGPSGRGVAAAPLFDKSWTETPEEKRQRKAQEKTAKRRELPAEEETPDMRRKREESAEKSKWVEEYNRSQRPRSLMEMHLESKSKGKRDRSDRGRGRDRERSPSSRRASKNDKEDDDDDEWKQQRFDRARDLSTGKVDSRRQREMLNTMGFLSDKYAPGKY
ncbi:hypothetical protein GGF44_006212 [Coemansia sp. RSA 1694]|nr:hypothetical protein GGF44_006212 [Coemansia sp. RSA 1694]